MAASLGDFLRTTVTAELFGQNILNIFYWRVTSITGLTGDYLSAINDELELNLITPMSDIQSSDLQYREILTQNVTNGIDFAVKTYTADELAGTHPTASLPSFVTLTFRLQRESLVTRNGYKRLSGIPENLVTGNDYVGSTVEIDAIEAAFSADIVIGIATIAEPVILKRPLPTIVPTSHLYSSIGGCDFRGVGSQNTRKGGGWE